MINKTCGRCKQNKSILDFTKNKRTKDGLCYMCSSCSREHSKLYHKNNKPKRSKDYKLWASKNREKIKEYKLKYYYGLSLKSYSDLLNSQNGSCAICFKFPKKEYKKLAVDHNHTTGQIRGLLCENCNTAIGHFKDSTSIVNRALDYLKFYEKKEIHKEKIETQKQKETSKI